MSRLAVSVEGETEAAFVNDILTPHLLEHGIYVTAVVVTTKRTIEGPNYRGGDVSVERATEETRRLLRSYTHVTTLYDFYGFRRRLPNEDVVALEQRLAATVGDPRFIPYVQRYEFESLLFSEGSAVERLFGSAAAGREIDAIRMQFEDPELINDSRETAPSKRLDAIFRNHVRRDYDKAAFGAVLAGYTGLDAIRRRCGRFNDWISNLEQLSPVAGQ